MNAIATLIRAAERLPLTDPMTLAGIDFLVGKTARRLGRGSAQSDAAFIGEMKAFPIAVHTDDANTQHYELPPKFFSLMLGEHRKYSSCYYTPDNPVGNHSAADSTADPAASLVKAERAALALTCEHAALEDGQTILELGCGWGSLTLWMAEHYPHANITAVSNSAPQRAYIVSRLQLAGRTNVRVITADMNDFSLPADLAQVDRIVSVEMFEHMANWHTLLNRARDWLRPEGKLFIHVFSHLGAPYRFDHRDPTDWIAQHFFTGGLMPSHGMIGQFSDVFTMEADWRWDGTHYEKTARAWLYNFDRHSHQIDALMVNVYGSDARLWKRRWRLFLLSTIGLFGHKQGSVWGVSHYLLKPVK